MPAEPSRTALVAWHADACEANVAPEGAPPTHGLWITTYPDDPSGPIQQDPFRIATIDAQQGGAVSAVQVFSPQIRTTTGVHIGSSVSELEAAYPGGFADHRHGYDTDVYAVDGPSGRLLIEAYDGSEDAGGRSEVALMSVVPPGTAPFALIPGDGLLGCPV
ncbi:hypothetical protein [Pseudolysinimonas sp.]|uniref:hypothetical protein n=1 Tax=Pseudolysinimonas sp. TaxID=2680009 RepID=UPI003F81FB9D